MKEKKVGFSELNMWLKIPIVLAWIQGSIYLIILVGEILLKIIKG